MVIRPARMYLLVAFLLFCLEVSTVAHVGLMSLLGTVFILLFTFAITMNLLWAWQWYPWKIIIHLTERGDQ